MANSKQPKLPSVDRISSMPESLLCHILTLLPTHNAVQTSTLSKRWKNLWTCITRLNFDGKLFTIPGMPQRFREENKRFDQFVNRVLLLLKTPSLQKFRLRCWHVCDPFLVSSWTYAALSRNVQKLILTVFLSEPFEIPISLFTCKTLSFLVLDCDNTPLDVPNSVCLPNLKQLSLHSIKYANDETIPKLLSGCPTLENISFRRTELDNVVNFSISSLTLKSLHISFESVFEVDSPQHTLQIDTPLLQDLRLKDHVSKEYVIGNLSSLIEADICVHVNRRNNDDTCYGNEVLKLINGLSNVKFLQLSGDTMKSLSYAGEHVAPVFRNLTRLQGNFSYFEQEPESYQPYHVPKYLLSRLTTVEISCYDGSTDELTMVKFILNGAKSLERLTLYICQDEETNVELLEEITMLPRDSKLCEFVVE